MPSPCYNDLRFISSRTDVMEEVAPLCADCPVALECLQLRIGEEEGVTAGLLPDAPERVAFREALDKRTTCPAGHPKSDYGVAVDVLVTEAKPVMGCTMCAALLRQLVAKVS